MHSKSSQQNRFISSRNRFDFFWSEENNGIAYHWPAHPPNQCLVRYNSDWWAGICSTLHHHQLRFNEHISISIHRLCAWDPTTSSTQVCCINVLHTSALYWNWAHMLLFHCIVTGSICLITEAVIDELGCAAYSSSTDDVLWTPVLVNNHHTQQVSPTCACTDVCTFVFCTLFQSTSVTRLVCRVRWCYDLWAGICIKFHHQLMMFWAHSLVLALVLCTSERCTGTWAHMLWFLCTSTTRSVSSDEAVIDELGCAAYSLSSDVVLWPCCLRQQPPYAASVSTSSTQLCLHWFSAHLSAVLGLGTLWYADSLCTAVTRSSCRVPWSSNWWAGICRILHHQLKMYCNSDCNQCACCFNGLNCTWIDAACRPSGHDLPNMICR